MPWREAIRVNFSQYLNVVVVVLSTVIEIIRAYLRHQAANGSDKS